MFHPAFIDKLLEIRKISRCGPAVTAKKCIKMCEAREKLWFRALLASHAGVFRGARFSSLPTRGLKNELP